MAVLDRYRRLQPVPAPPEVPFTSLPLHWGLVYVVVRRYLQEKRAEGAPTDNARAAKQLGHSVPVVSGGTAERRGLKPSETARAIRRLYELHGITENKGGRPVKENPLTVRGIMPEKTVEDVARDAGVSPGKARRLNRIADLIPALMERLDARTITQEMAYGFAQLSVAEQEDVWETDDGTLLLDGHNRKDICERHGIAFRCQDVPGITDRGDAELWIMANQLARRNLRDEQRSYLRGKYVKGLDVKLGRPKKGDNLSPLSTVAAHEHVTERTVERDADYAAAVDTVERNVPGARETILAGESGLPKAEVVKLAKKPRAEQQAARGLSHRGSGTAP